MTLILFIVEFRDIKFDAVTFNETKFSILVVIGPARIKLPILATSITILLVVILSLTIVDILALLALNDAALIFKPIKVDAEIFVTSRLFPIISETLKFPALKLMTSNDAALMLSE